MILQKRYIIPIFIPHYGCPHSCVFCNQHRITGKITTVDAADIQNTMDYHLPPITPDRLIEVAFYGGSFTALPGAIQQRLLYPAKQAFREGRIHGIRVSTRPDAITEEIVQLLSENNVTTIELGVQSLDNAVLIAAGRGHSVRDVELAAEILQRSNFAWGIQLMPGLPAEDWYSLLLTGIRALKLKPHFARIYPTLVIKQTALEVQYRQNNYMPLSLAEAIKRAAFLKVLFEQHNIKVIRTGLQATEELDQGDTIVAGPYHPAFGELVDGFIFRQLLLRALNHIPYYPAVTIHCHYRDESKIRGQKNSHLHQISAASNRKIKLSTSRVQLGNVVIEQQGRNYVINSLMTNAWEVFSRNF